MKNQAFPGDEMKRLTFKRMLLILVQSAVLLTASCSTINTLPRAAMCNDVDGIRQRLELGDNINMHDRYGWTPLMWAVYYNQLNAVRYLISRGANVNCVARDDYGSFYRGATPLMLCAMYDYRVLANLLIRSGAHVGLKDRYGSTAFTIAELNNFLEMADLLEKASKNANRGDREKG
jgi:ankyrin repeat protein